MNFPREGLSASARVLTSVGFVRAISPGKVLISCAEASAYCATAGAALVSQAPPMRVVHESRSSTVPRDRCSDIRVPSGPPFPQAGSIGDGTAQWEFLHPRLLWRDRALAGSRRSTRRRESPSDARAELHRRI